MSASPSLGLLFIIFLLTVSNTPCACKGDLFFITLQLKLVFESPVWSSLLTLRDLDRNHNRSIKVLEPQKTGPDHL